jgi:hypothetical protein
VAEREASGEFDYLIGDRTVADAPERAEVLPRQVPVDPDDGLWVGETETSDDGSFDPFDERTWYFEPAPVPWYRSKQALTALIATAAAAVAIVVSGVLLVFRGPGSGADVDATTPVTPTAPSTVASSVASSESASSPEPPPPPPPETSAAPAEPPAQTYQPQAPRSTKEPEIGVTRTPVTRSQLSVAPQRPGGHGTSR